MGKSYIYNYRLAGPLHGLANQEVLRWLLQCQQTLGENPSDSALEKYAVVVDEDIYLKCIMYHSWHH